jgi:hypothetical protein
MTAIQIAPAFEKPETLEEAKYPARWQIEVDGRRLPVTNLFDIHGDMTDQPIRAHRVVAYAGPGQWHVYACEPHEIEPLYAKI